MRYSRKWKENVFKIKMKPNVNPVYIFYPWYQCCVAMDAAHIQHTSRMLQILQWAATFCCTALNMPGLVAKMTRGLRCIYLATEKATQMTCFPRVFVVGWRKSQASRMPAILFWELLSPCCSTVWNCQDPSSLDLDSLDLLEVSHNSMNKKQA